MKIAIINSVYKVGSTGRICSDFISFSEKRGHVSKCFYGRKKQKDNNAKYFGSLFGFAFHLLMSRLFDAEGLWSVHSTKKLISFLKEFNADIYLLNNLHGYYVNYPMLFDFLKNQHKNVFWIFHDCWNFTGHCAYYLYNGCDKWQLHCKKCKFHTGYPKSLFVERSYNNFDLKKKLFNDVDKLTIICPSQWIANDTKKSFFKSKQIIVINNGIDINKFHKKDDCVFLKKHNIEHYNIILCIAYILDKRKGIFDIVKMSNILSSDEIIVLVGRIREYKDALPRNIIHIDKTDNVDELIDIYSSCKVLFNPTYEDTFSNINMEAMSCGLPVVCYDSGGASEMIDQNFKVQPGDINAAYVLIKKIINNNDCYDFSNCKNFSMHNTFAKYLTVFKQ